MMGGKRKLLVGTVDTNTVCGRAVLLVGVKRLLTEWSTS